MKPVLVFETFFGKLRENQWPTEFGSIFVAPIHKVTPSAKAWGVFQWVDNPHDNVMGLGEFWEKNDAIIFADAKAASV